MSLKQLAQKRLTLTLLGITIFVSATLAHSRTKSSRLMRRMLTNDADGIAIDERFMPAPLSHKAATIAD